MDPALASIPSPSQSVWHLGPLPLRAYALCIIVGIVVAIWLTTKRWRDRGGNPDHVWDVAGWAIVFGIIGGRLYHVLSDPEKYFLGREGTSPINALKIWDGGLGIWGAIALGGVGAWIGCRRRGIKLAVFADAAVPGVIFAQAIGRLGNWFNNELYGAPTNLPWGLEIHNISVETGTASACRVSDTGADLANNICGTYQPTFLYELLWNVAIGVALLLLDRRFRLGRGAVFALYLMGYTLGRVWIELLRRDDANHILGLRLNVWTSIIVFAIGLILFLRLGGFRAEREPSPYLAGADPTVGADADDTTGDRESTAANEDDDTDATDDTDDTDAAELSEEATVKDGRDA